MRQGASAALAIGRLFTDEELSRLADALATTRGVAAALGMALVRERWAALVARRSRPLREAAGPDYLAGPEAALDYFRSLVPELGHDPMRFGDEQRRTAFTLAVATDRELLSRVQAVIADALQAGDSVRTGAAAVRRVLDAAGVSAANPSYPEMVFRTNTIEAYNTGAWDELRQPDVQEFFPCWRYSNPSDGRSRPTHAARDGLYWASSVPFAAVRGTQPADVCNCRCTFIPTDKWDYQRLLSQGVDIRTAP